MTKVKDATKNTITDLWKMIETKFKFWIGWIYVTLY